MPLPAPALREQAQLEVRFAASFAGETEAAMRSLLAYPYGCIEQTMDRLIPFAVAPATARRLAGSRKADPIEEIAERLRAFPFERRTGIGFWPNARPDLFATTWAVLVLAASRAAGLELDESLVTDARKGLVELLSSRPERIPDDLAALAMFAVADSGGRVPQAWVARFPSESNLHSDFATAMAAMALAKLHPGAPSARAMLSTLSVRLREGTTTARAAATPGRTGLPRSSATTAQAAVLWAFARLWPDHPIVEKLTTSLLLDRQGAAWNSTFENALSILALSALGGLREGSVSASASMKVEDSPLLTATPLPLDGQPLLRDWRLGQILAPATRLQRDSSTIALQAGSETPVSFVVSLSYPSRDASGASNAGIAVATPYRTRFGVLGTREPVEAGEVVAIDLALTSDEEREHVAVTIPLPAGMEPFDLSLGHNAGLIAPNLAPLLQLDVAAEELHKDRISIFVRRLERGLPRRHTVYARAATPGTFLAPGAHAEAMYTPSVQGRAGVQKIEIVSPTVER
jgi:hypothetical protein